MGVIERLNSWVTGVPVERAASTIPPLRPSIDAWWPFVNFGGGSYPLGDLTTTIPAEKGEEIGADFVSLVGGAYKSNAVVFACILTRLQVFSQARFMWQALRKGQPDELFGTPSLSLLEHPWPGATTGDLLTRMVQSADLAGNAFVVSRRRRLSVLRPDWVAIIVGSPDDASVDAWDIDAELVGYVYFPGGRYSGRRPVVLDRSEVAHFAPIPDPDARFKGMSWVTPLIREVMGDSAATTHKLRFFQNGATPNMIVRRTDSPAPEVFRDWVKLMEEKHSGAANAYKTFYLTSGADATVVGRDFQQMDFKVTQGAGETRIAAASGVHPVIVGLSEGMQGSSLNAGNFGSARRLVADKTLWHLWSNAAGSLETIVPPPNASRLWVDDRIPFLREDRKDAAEIQNIKATIIRTLTDGGYEPKSIIRAVEAEDYNLLEWTGMVSVQLQPPGTDVSAPSPAPMNGKVPAETEA